MWWPIATFRAVNKFFGRSLKLRRTNRAAAIALAAVLVLGTAAIAVARRTGDTATPVPVVVELFTSEGCSSCPPIDTFLRKVDMLQPIKGVQVIGIEEHVDYWNQDGWVDPYSALEWTNRQDAYVMKFKDKTPFTPQLIVGGAQEMVGANTVAIFNAIRTAAQQENVRVSVQPGAADGNDARQFAIRVASAAGAGKISKADVWLAVTEDGLQMQVTGGENNGRTLQHASVIRSLEKIGSLSDKDGAAFTSHPRVKFKSGWNKSNLHVVVFVQDHKSLRIVGAGSSKVSS
ncbi:MAG TPA: DUF1223 domain-containing protein [Candidatus Acidoferrum sp.]|nr:DUF1223 domain-containing protein [Candidatus Acidoferrum sp.]